MPRKFIVQVGYTRLAFDEQEDALRTYAMISTATPCTHVYCYGADQKAPESLEKVSLVRDADVELKLETIDASAFALHLTAEEYREKCKVQPTEIDGDARLVEVGATPAALAGPGTDGSSDADIF